MRNVVVINGPNLNLLGRREPRVYGRHTLADLESRVVGWGTDNGLSVETYQSNHEGDVIDRMHQAAGYADGIVLNAGALTHYSYALHDAIKAVELPTVEVHISNIHAREEWRRHSVIAPACVYSIFGRGIEGYRDALAHLRWRSAAPFSTHPYGDTPDQVGDLRLPNGEGPFPVAVTIHGDLWRETTTRDLMEGIAVDLRRRGWATWNIEFHRVDAGGGWTRTLEDVAAAVDALAEMDAPLDLDHVISVGHSSGGQLALWAAARHRMPDGEEPPHIVAGPKIALAAAVALAPLADLTAAHRRGTGDRAVEAFLRRSPDDDPARYRASSPMELLPLGAPQIIVHPGADDVVDPDMTAEYVERARAAGDDVAYLEPPGLDHRSALDPSGPAWTAAADELAELYRSSPDDT